MQGTQILAVKGGLVSICCGDSARQGYNGSCYAKVAACSREDSLMRDSCDMESSNALSVGEAVQYCSRLFDMTASLRLLQSISLGKLVYGETSVAHG